jgi:hypothetical protein
MCRRCYYACSFGAQPHGEAGAEWLAETIAYLDTTGPQPDGGYVLYCGGLDLHAHLDGGEPYFGRHFQE